MNTRRIERSPGICIDATDDDGNVLPCRGQLTNVRCGEPLNEDGTCDACDTKLCEVCGLVFLRADCVFDAIWVCRADFAKWESEAA